MKKFAIGLLALLLLAGAGFFSVNQYVQWRATQEVDAVFSALRTAGREAAHGGVAFDLFKRSLTVRSVLLREPDGSRVAIASLVLDGVTEPKDGRVSARRLGAEGIEVEIAAAGERPRTLYQAPGASVDLYSGPDTLLPRERGQHEALNLFLRQMAASEATSLSIPELSVRIEAPGAGGVATALGYRNILIEKIAQGRIERLSFADMGFTATAPAGQPDLAAKGSLKRFVATGIDTAPILAATRAPGKAGLQPVYGEVVATGYSVVHGDGSQMEVGEASAKGLAIDPSLGVLGKFEELATLGQKQQPLGDADSARLMETASDLVKAIGFTQFRLADVTAMDSGTSLKMGSLTLSEMKQGRLERLALERISAATDGDKPVLIDTLALKGLSPLPLFAFSARAASEGSVPGLDGLLTLFRALDGVEMKGLTAPVADSDVPFRIQDFSLDWSQFIGLVPTRIAMKIDGMSGPISEADGVPLAYLAAAGLKQASIGLQLGITYDPAAQSLRLAPGAMRVEQAFAADLDLSLAELRSGAFEDPIAALAAAQQVAVGPLTLMVTDLGFVDIILKEKAAGAGTTPDAVRTEFTDTLRKAGAELAPLYPEAPAVAEALARFTEKPGTLTLRLVPFSGLKLMDAIAADPLVLLREFRISATNSTP